MSNIPSSNSVSNPFVTPPLSFPRTASGTSPEATPDLPASTATPEQSFQLDNLSAQSDLSPHFVDYEVKKGDTLSKIAKETLGSPADYMDIFEANKDQMRNPNDLSIGMILKIPTPPNLVDFPIGVPATSTEVPATSTETPATSTEVPATSTEVPATSTETPATSTEVPATSTEVPATSTETPAVSTETPETPAEPAFNEVTVKSGDSLSSLALKHLGNSDRYMEIFEANRDQLKRPESLSVGMTLKIPVSSDRASDESGVAPVVSTTAPADLENLNPRATELYEALKNYQTHHRELGNTHRAETTDAELREIAVEADRAGTAFDVDPKIMLAVFAHESIGFDPRARSNTGAGGLGQLTGIAIRQVHYMAGMAPGQRGREPYTQYPDNFIQSETNINQRFNIKQNIWTATAYMAYEIKDRNNGNIEEAVENYGDPNVATYENLVNEEHNTLFGTDLF